MEAGQQKMGCAVLPVLSSCTQAVSRSTASQVLPLEAASSCGIWSLIKKFEAEGKLCVCMISLSVCMEGLHELQEYASF